MKRITKIISILILFINILCVSVINDSRKVNAEDLVLTPSSSAVTIYDKEEGSLTVSPKGVISLKYLYGYSELFIKVRKCSNIDANKNLCYEFANINVLIIHLAGAENNTGEMKTKTINLDNYLAKGTIVQLEFIFSFMTTANGQDSNTGQYEPLYCNSAFSIKNCSGSNKKLPQYRVETFLCGNEEGCLNNYDVKYEHSGGAIIYKGPSGLVYEFSPKNSVEACYIKIGGGENQNISEDESLGPINTIVYDTIIPVLLVILGIAASLSITILGYKIIKASDSPNERQEYIGQLRGILIGIGVAAILLFVLEPAANLIKKLIK